MGRSNSDRVITIGSTAFCFPSGFVVRNVAVFTKIHSLRWKEGWGGQGILTTMIFVDDIHLHYKMLVYLKIVRTQRKGYNSKYHFCPLVLLLYFIQIVRDSV